MKKVDKPFKVEKADLKKYPRNEQRRFLQLGMVKNAPVAEEQPKKAAK